MTTYIGTCDRCDLPNAVRRVTLPSGLELLFCEHHYQENRAALETQFNETFSII